MSADTEDSLDDVEADYEALAEKLAALSQGDTPTGFGRAPSPFEGSEVDWASNGWLARVQGIQGWLNLDGPIAIKNGAADALDTLFEMLGSAVPAECYRIIDGHATLTTNGISALEARVDTALNHKEAFAQKLEEGETVASASRAWLEAWEDEPPTIDDGKPTEVHANVNTWSIHTFRDQANERSLVLNPSYQRGSVWSDTESAELIDSVLRGIPLPSIILNQRANDDSVEIVDGKQRLTAILRFIGRHPDALTFAQTRSEETGVPFAMFHENYKSWRKAVKKASGLTGKEEAENFLPFAYRLPKASRDTGPLLRLDGKYYCELKNESVQIQGKAEKIHKLFESPTTEYKLSVILYKDTAIRQIHKVFGLYNRQGKKLNATEVRNAIYHHLSLAKLLLFLSGDSANLEELAPYLASQSSNLSVIPDMLKAMNVSEARFNRTKITSWVTALIVHRLEDKQKASTKGKARPLTTPGSTTLIESMMLSISDSKAHAMRNQASCLAFATALRGGAELLTDLRNVEAFAPQFTHRGDPGEKWDDLPAVATWTACALAAIAGVDSAPDLREAVLLASTQIKPLEKQQASSQWRYLSNAVIQLLEAMGVAQETLGLTLEKRFGNNCLATFEARRGVVAS